MNDLLNKVKNIVLEKNYKISKFDAAIMELYQNFICLKNKDIFYDIEKIKKDFCDYVLSIPENARAAELASANSKCIWGLKPSRESSEKILNSIYEGKEVLFAEDAFIRCIVGNSHLLSENKKKYQVSVGYIIEDLSCYIDATRPSRMELILNSKLEITNEQIKRAKKVIKKLIETKVSKYNNQPILNSIIGRKNVKKVLVVDQSYKDYSILKGCANDSTFEIMLECAINENPDADIIVKTHPDAIGEDSTKIKCYYQYLKEKNNIYKITQPINPISMIEYVDKVYVCSSQLGFEALMCGKEVHTFGLPFYAGWGLTIDNQKCERRTRTRTLEELFYIAYILMPIYINPSKNAKCEIEDVINYLIELREQYFYEKDDIE